MKKFTTLFSLFAFLYSTQSFAQIKILMLNGKTRDVKQYEVKGEWVFYKRADDQKDKLRKMDKFNVFSATKTDGTEEIIYDPDTTLDGDPSVDQVRNYIRGEQYGRANYFKPFNAFESELVGVGSGMLSFYGPAAIFVNALVIGRINPRHIPPSDTIESAIFNSEEFKSGYNKYARNKKIKDSLIFGGFGFAVGFAFFSLVLK